MTELNDRELGRYLRGEGALSRKYREASRETAPPDLDDPILVRARAEVSAERRPRRPWFTGLGLAASLVLAVNLGWNVYHSEKAQVGELKKQGSAAEGFVPAPPATVPEPPATADRAAPAEAPPPPRPQRPAPADTMRAREAEQKVEAQSRVFRAEAEQQTYEERARGDRVAQLRAEAAGSPAPSANAMSVAPAMEQPREKAALSESEKIDRLLAYVGEQKAMFIRNGEAYPPADAVRHLRMKREKAGKRVKTAEDFIRLCASKSSVSGEDYLIRYADGHTRPSKDALREELARINAGG